MHTKDQDTNQETTNEETPKTLDEQVEDVMKGLRQNTTERAIRGVVLVAGVVTAVVFGTASLGWTKWLLRVLSGFLGLGASEAYGWMKNRSDCKRFRAIIQGAQNVYAKEGEARAEAYLRDELSKYEAEEKARREEFERKVGDVDAVAVQAAEARKDAADAVRMTEKAAENLDHTVTRLEEIDKKVEDVGSKASGMIKGIEGRLDSLNKKADASIPIEAVPTKTSSKKSTRKPSKKAANG